MATKEEKTTLAGMYAEIDDCLQVVGTSVTLDKGLLLNWKSIIREVVNG